MSDPINPRQVQVTGDHMVTGVITMKEALERRIDQMAPIYYAAMALTKAEIELILDMLANCEELESLERFEALRDACRRAKEGK